MFLDLEWFIRRLLPFWHTPRQCLNNHIKGTIIEEGTGISIFLGQRADDPMHGATIAVVRPAFWR
jgi:hypothetical protein